MNPKNNLLTIACIAGVIAANSQSALASFVGPSNTPNTGTSPAINWNQPLPAPVKKVTAPSRGPGMVPASSGLTLTFDPATIAGDFRGYIDVQIAGINSGETVRLEKFQVNNTNGTIDGSALLVESLLLTDGRAAAIGGVTNSNVTADLTAVDGAIVAELSFLDAFLPSMAGEYVFRLSSPANRFPPLAARFTVTSAPAAQQVGGMVTASGAGVAHAYVALFDVDGGSYDFVAGTVADIHGTYTIPAPPGSYHLVTARPGFVGGFDEGATRVQLAGGVNRTMNPALYAGTRTISGRLTDAANPSLGLPGVEILLRNGAQTKIALAHTDADGNWSAAVTPDEWEIEVLAWSVTQIGFVGLRTPVFADTTAASANNIVLRLPRTETIVRGTVADAGAPLPYVDVTLFSQDLKYWLTVSTDEDGQYVAGVSAGVWQVRLDAASLDGLGYAGLVSGFLPLKSGQVVAADFAPLATTTEVEGYVVDDQGEPVPGVVFTLADPANSRLTYVAGESDEAGEFFNVLPDGTFNFEVELESLAGLGLIDAEAPPLITTGAKLIDVGLVLKTPTAHLAVHVKDQFGQPAIDLPLLATAQIGDRRHRSFDYTDEEGTVHLPVINGTWALQLTGADPFFKLESHGYVTTTNRQVLIAGADATHHLTLMLIPPRMTIMRASSESMQVTWATPLDGFALEWNLGLTGLWLPVESEPVNANDSFSITVPLTEPFRFFRLSRP